MIVVFANRPLSKPSSPPVLMTDGPAIVVEELRKTYRDGLFSRRRVEALRGVSLQVERGEIFGLLGPNGAGKTTLIKVLLGIVSRGHGQATLLGLPAGDRQGRRLVGYLPESHRIPRHHTGRSALLYYGSLSGLSRAETLRRLPQMLELVGLESWGDTSVRKYSKGMQQRLGLAQALLHDPELLILDEPTDGVDPVGRSEMRTLMQKLKAQGKTIFLNSHLLQELELVCDRVAILDHGRVLREGHIADVTLRTHSEVQMVLAGDGAQIRLALTDYDVSELAPLADSQYEVAVRGVDQQQIDTLVDDLRRRGVSLVTLVRRRQTLEEAFLDIIAEARRAP